MMYSIKERVIRYYKCEAEHENMMNIIIWILSLLILLKQIWCVRACWSLASRLVFISTRRSVPFDAALGFASMKTEFCLRSGLQSLLSIALLRLKGIGGMSVYSAIWLFMAAGHFSVVSQLPPFNPCGANDSRSSGLSWTNTWHPGGANGVDVKSKHPLICSWANSFGFMQEPRKRFNVISPWGKNWSHKCNEQSGFKPHRREI